MKLNPGNTNYAVKFGASRSSEEKTAKQQLKAERREIDTLAANLQNRRDAVTQHQLHDPMHPTGKALKTGTSHVQEDLAAFKEDPKTFQNVLTSLTTHKREVRMAEEALAAKIKKAPALLWGILKF